MSVEMSCVTLVPSLSPAVAAMVEEVVVLILVVVVVLVDPKCTSFSCVIIVLLESFSIGKLRMGDTDGIGHLAETFPSGDTLTGLSLTEFGRGGSEMVTDFRVLLSFLDFELTGFLFSSIQIVVIT